MQVPEMLVKLNKMYDREEYIKKQFIILKKEYDQLREDIEMLQTAIMYQSNKNYRQGRNG